MARVTAARTFRQEVTRQTGRTWAVFVLLAFGLWLVWSDPVLLWTYRKLPAAVGAWGVGSWLVRMTMFRTAAESGSWPGALLNAAIVVGAALVVAAVM